MIPFNKIHLAGDEMRLIEETFKRGKISGDGHYSHLCERFFEERYGYKKTLLTTSCTDALEMAALLIDLAPGDEIIMPSYTFVSMANAFIIHGAKLVFADSCADQPNVDVSKIEALVTPRTKAIVTMHYGGVANEVAEVRRIADKHNIYLIEDAAHAIDSHSDGKPLGSFGHLAAFSFHETKNITCGEGGLLIINHEPFIKRSEIIREKGTNRRALLRGEVDKYTWVDVGASFLPSDILCAFLYAQLENLDQIQTRRKEIWDSYHKALNPLHKKGLIKIQQLSSNVEQNGHIFYLVCKNIRQRSAFIAHMKSHEIGTPFHYIALHNSPFYKDKHDGRALPFAEQYEDCLVRLPLFYDMTAEDIERVTNQVISFFNN